ncbi:unnamed protein product [Durusdinium trenchii]|uniref:Uncharacterized protein n=2 Tax=Durusdinium trenchii TaxID=1381693 RepID=A0ABP0M6N6_9DINO
MLTCMMLPAMGGPPAAPHALHKTCTGGAGRIWHSAELRFACCSMAIAGAGARAIQAAYRRRSQGKRQVRHAGRIVVLDNLQAVQFPAEEDDLLSLGPPTLCSADTDVQRFKLCRAIMKARDRLAMLAVVASNFKETAVITARICLIIEELRSGRPFRTRSDLDLASGRLVMMALLGLSTSPNRFGLLQHDAAHHLALCGGPDVALQTPVTPDVPISPIVSC